MKLWSFLLFLSCTVAPARTFLPGVSPYPQMVIPRGYNPGVGCHPCQMHPSVGTPFPYHYRPSRGPGLPTMHLGRQPFQLDFSNSDWSMYAQAPPLYEYRFHPDHRHQVYAMPASSGVSNDYYHYFRRNRAREQFNYMGVYPEMHYDPDRDSFYSMERDTGDYYRSDYKLGEGEFKFVSTTKKRARPITIRPRPVLRQAQRSPVPAPVSTPSSSPTPALESKGTIQLEPVPLIEELDKSSSTPLVVPRSLPPVVAPEPQVQNVPQRSDSVAPVVAPSPSPSMVPRPELRKRVQGPKESIIEELDPAGPTPLNIPAPLASVVSSEGDSVWYEPRPPPREPTREEIEEADREEVANLLEALDETHQALEDHGEQERECSSEEEGLSEKRVEEEFLRQVVICALNKIYPHPPPLKARRDLLDFSLPGLVQGFKDYGFRSETQKSHFLAQIIHESSGFTGTIEGAFMTSRGGWNCSSYSEKVEKTRERYSRAKYGHTFRGRGLIQITGCTNYLKFFYHTAARKKGKTPDERSFLRLLAEAPVPRVALGNSFSRPPRYL